ncbi:MAG: ribosomal protein L7/L12 [Verrucomicrobiales bacterium]|jgi:ribosomal protein L7/L12
MNDSLERAHTMPEEHLSEVQRQNIINCVRSGRKIEAIKIYREATGANLAESKQVIETLAARISENAPSLANSGENEVAALLSQGNKIAAIKLYRKNTGAGLKEAKDKVEALAKSLDIAQPPTTSRKASGCGTSVFMSIAFVALVSAILWNL